jgi:hypothetical protein
LVCSCQKKLGQTFPLLSIHTCHKTFVHYWLLRFISNDGYFVIFVCLLSSDKYPHSRGPISQVPVCHPVVGTTTDHEQL